MSPFIQVLFNVLVNATEAFLIYLLLSRKLHLKPCLPLIWICFILQTLSVTCMNQLISTDSLRMAVTLLIDSCIALILSTDFPARSVFWGCAYPLITVLADTVTVLFGRLFILGDWKTLMEYPVSILMTFLYLFICFCCVLLLIRKNSPGIVFPWFIQVFWLLIVAAGITASEFLLDLLSQLKEYSSGTSSRLFLSVLLLLVILFLSVFLFYYIGILYRNNLDLMEENRQKQFEKQQFDLLSSTNHLLRTWKHDFQHHLSVLEIMLSENDTASASGYLDSIVKEMKRSSWQIQTGNTVLDAVLTSKLPAIQSRGIPFSHSIFLPDSLPLGSLELTSLMGNLLDNAIESCSSQNESAEKYIKLEIKPYNQFLYIDMTNSSTGKYHYDHTNVLQSTKGTGGHGIGLKRIGQIVTDAQGFMKISPEKDSFHITIVLPLQNQPTSKGEPYEP